MAKENQMDQTNAGSKIDAIKEIIFGQNMLQYEEEFSNIKENIKLNLEAIDKEFNRHKELMAAMEKSLTEKLDKNHAFLLEELKKLDHKKTDRKLLSELLQEMSKKIGS